MKFGAPHTSLEAAAICIRAIIDPCTFFFSELLTDGSVRENPSTPLEQGP